MKERAKVLSIFSGDAWICTYGIKFPNFSLIFQRQKIKIPWKQWPTNHTAATNKVGDQTPLKAI